MANVLGAHQEAVDQLCALVWSSTAEEFPGLLGSRSSPGQVQVNSTEELRITAGGTGSFFEIQHTGCDQLVNQLVQRACLFIYFGCTRIAGAGQEYGNC
jgi:hypothetical protein